MHWINAVVVFVWHFLFLVLNHMLLSLYITFPVFGVAPAHAGAVVYSQGNTTIKQYAARINTGNYRIYNNAVTMLKKSIAYTIKILTAL